MGIKWHLEDMAQKNARELEELFRFGRTPMPEMLAGYEFQGFNHPWWLNLAGIRKFKKGFFLAPNGGGLEGYNIPVIQNGLGGEWLCLPADDEPKRFGFYEVYKVRMQERDNKYPNALLLNYGSSSRNPWYEGAKVLRDYLVQVEEGNEDLFLGKAYLALGPLRPAVSFFILERHRKSGYQPE